MRPTTSSARRRRAARRLATRRGECASWRPVGTRWAQPSTGQRTPTPDARGVQVRGAAKKGVRTRSRRAMVRKCRFSNLQRSRHRKAMRMLRSTAWRSSYNVEKRTGIYVAGRWRRRG